MRILKGKLRLEYYVWRNIHIYHSLFLLFIVLFVSATVLFFINRYLYSSIGLVLIPVAYVLGLYTYNKYVVWSSGAKGEDVSTESLRNLSDDYVLLNGVLLPGNRGDIDHVIIGPNGIFVMESKNYGGEISCDGDEWQRHKIGRRGKKYSLWIGSPSNQVKRNAKLLKDLLLEHRKEIFGKYTPHIWVYAIVGFTNPNCNLNLKKPTVAVLTAAEFCDFIENQESETAFSQEQVDNIAKAILKYSR